MFRYKKLFAYLFLLIFPLYYASSIFADEKREDCRICGMWIDQYIRTRHVLTKTDGTQEYLCSYTCTAKYLKTNHVKPKLLQVADYLTTEPVDAGNAFYLVGSDALPVMSYISIIAFATKDSAESFQEMHGGKVMSFTEVMAEY